MRYRAGCAEADRHVVRHPRVAGPAAGGGPRADAAGAAPPPPLPAPGPRAGPPRTAEPRGAPLPPRPTGVGGGWARGARSRDRAVARRRLREGEPRGGPGLRGGAGRGHSRDRQSPIRRRLTDALCRTRSDKARRSISVAPPSTLGGMAPTELGSPRVTSDGW